MAKLLKPLKKKFAKQLSFLLKNPYHPSLKSRKMEGKDLFEARLDYHNRFIFKIINGELWFYAIGSHDTGLGKK